MHERGLKVDRDADRAAFGRSRHTEIDRGEYEQDQPDRKTAGDRRLVPDHVPNFLVVGAPTGDCLTSNL